MKKALAVCLAALLASLCAVATAQTTSPLLLIEPSVDFAMQVTQTIADMGDNPDVGNRSSGSEAERQAAAFIQQTMEEIGLSNVTADAFTSDNWTFNRGRVYYTDETGAQQFLPLGGFATNLTTDMQEVKVVYAGRGTEADYDGLDVQGKVVLIDINQAEDWWIEIPTYEAYTHGALCVLACNNAGYATYDRDTIGSQDICGPAYAPAFSLSQNSADILKALIAEGNGEAEIVLDVESIVTLDGSSQNIWGEIPGQTDEVIYFFAHYDGYYHSYFDDASGIGSMLAIAKAFAESGYVPDKTIRFVAHGSEEWGDSDTEYDWAIGAFKQITEVHPEWAEKAFAILNIDGMYPVKGHTAFSIAASYELQDFAEAIGVPLYEGSAYALEVTAPATCWTEDFSYGIAGVPAIVASHATPEEVYHATAYHSSMDNVVLGVDEAAWQMTLDLFVRYTEELDRLACRPMVFSSRFAEMADSYTGDADLGFDQAIAAAAALDARVAALNADYTAALDAGSDTAASLREEGIALNDVMFSIYRTIMQATTAFDWEDNVIFPFEVTFQNIEALRQSITCLESGDAAAALDEWLYSVDYNWYAYDFSKATYDYMLDKMYVKAEGTWGEGMIRYPGENLWEVIHSLADKASEEGADFTEEIASLNESLSRQNDYAADLDSRLTQDLHAITAMLTDASN